MIVKRHAGGNLIRDVETLTHVTDGLWPTKKWTNLPNELATTTVYTRKDGAGVVLKVNPPKGGIKKYFRLTQVMQASERHEECGRVKLRSLYGLKQDRFVNIVTKKGRLIV